MLNQGYLKAFINDDNTISIFSGHGESKDFQTIEIESITIQISDAKALAKALIELSKIDVNEWHV